MFKWNCSGCNNWKKSVWHSFLTNRHHQHNYKSVMYIVCSLCDYYVLSGCCRTAGTMAPSTSTAWTRWAGELWLVSITILISDWLARTALLMAIDNENLEMVEVLLENKVETKDALLHAINEEFVEAVEVLLDHEESIHAEGEPWVSWMGKRPSNKLGLIVRILE